MSRFPSKLAGVLPPTTAPKFEIVRKPLWRANNRTASADPEADPIAGTDSGQNVLYHYQGNGNAYLRQPWNAAMAWSSNTTPANAGVFAFKCLVKPYDVSGRRLLYSTKRSLKSGGIFVDMVDGRARVGWYDTTQKREVFIETNVPVFDPNHWHYVYVRKRYPSTTLGSGCWTDTISNLTALLTNDVLLVRRFRKAAVLHPALQKPWDYKPHDPAHASGVTFQRNYIGFTTDLEYSVASSTATGLVSRADRTFGGAGAGVITASAAIYSPDMIGMYHWFADIPDRIFVISAVATTLTCTVVDATTGVTENMAAVTSSAGGVYSGVRLLKSEGFDESQSVDSTSYDIELFGSHIAEDPESGVLPFKGEFSSFAYGAFSGAVPSIFEATTADNACDGADPFENVEIYDANLTGPDELRVANTSAFTAVDIQPYAGAVPTSTLANEELKVAPDSAASSALARPLEWQFLRARTELEKRRVVRCAFYDPDQAQVSAGGPELIVQAGGDDASSSSGDVQLTISDLPVSPDRGRIETRVYVSLPGGETLFLAAEVSNGVSSVTIDKTDYELVNQPELEFDNAAPPDCGSIEAVGDLLVCGDLRNVANDQNGTPVGIPDGVVFSKSFYPVTFPGDNLLTVPAGTPGVTGLRSLNGRLVIAKATGLFRAMLRQSAASTEEISPSIGAFSGAAMVVNDNVLFFWGPRGIYAYTGSGIPEWIGAPVRELFQSGAIKKGSAFSCVGAVNRRRNQAAWTIRLAGLARQSHRLSVELAQGGPRFSRYATPNLTALGELQRPLGDVAAFVGGTDEGFVVWLDRDSSQAVMVNHGATALTVNGSAGTSRIPVTGTIDTALSGARGAVLSTPVGDAVVLFAASGALYLDTALASAPANAAALTLGLPERFVETKWFDLGNPENDKKLRYLSVLCTQGSGTITVTAFKDYGATAYSLIPRPNAPDSEIDLAGAAVQRFDIGHIHARHVKFRFESADQFEIIEAVLRVHDADQY